MNSCNLTLKDFVSLFGQVDDANCAPMLQVNRLTSSDVWNDQGQGQRSHQKYQNDSLTLSYELSGDQKV